jgi:hypothetical protein
MDRRPAPFKYRLASVLKLDQWEGRVLGAELARARSLVDERRKRVNEVLQRIEQAQIAMRELHQANTMIPIERRRLLAAYLEEQYGAATSSKRELAQAEQLFEQIMVQRQAKQRRIRAMEQQEERERADHDAEQTRLGLRDADELWLTRGQR